MSPSRIVLAYHGCDRAVGEAVLAGQAEIRPSTNDYDWLGSGAYFWEDSPARALDWAKFLQSQPASSPGKISNPFAIGAVIATGTCLDLTDTGSLKIVREAYEECARLLGDLEVELPINQPGFRGDEDLVKRHLDCTVLNFVHQLRLTMGEPPFDTIRCPFFEGEPLFPGARIAARTHLQWCVREPAQSVLGYFRLRA